MRDLIIFGMFGLVSLIPITVIYKRHAALETLATSRAPLDRHGFIDRMVRAGVSERAAAITWEIARARCSKRVTPYPEDLWATTLRINPDELHEELATVAEKYGWNVFSTTFSMGSLDDPSLLQVGRYIDKISSRKAS